MRIQWDERVIFAAAAVMVMVEGLVWRGEDARIFGVHYCADESAGNELDPAPLQCLSKAERVWSIFQSTCDVK